MPAKKKNPFKAMLANIGSVEDHIDNLLDLRKSLPKFAPSSASCDNGLDLIDGLVRTLCNVACCEIPPEVGPPPKVHYDCFRHNAEGRFDCDCDKLFAIDAAIEAGNPNGQYHEDGKCDTKFACPRHDREALA